MHVTVKQDATASSQSLSEMRAQTTQQQQQQSEAEQQEDLDAAEVLTTYKYYNLSYIVLYLRTHVQYHSVSVQYTQALAVLSN
jgi:hypothetical protein